MTSPFPDAAEPVAGAAWHAGEDLLTGYAAGTIEPVAVWSVEAHLTGCACCRSALSAQVDPRRLARNRSVVLVRAAIGDGGRVRRLLCRCGVPDHLLRPARGDPVAAQVLAAVRGRRAGRGGRRSRGSQVWLDRGQRVRAPGRVSGPGGPGAVPAGGPSAGAGGGRGGVPADVRSRSPAGGCGPLLRLYLAAGPRRLRAGRSAGAGGRRRVRACRAQGGCRSRCCCRRWRCARSRSRPRPSWTPAAAAVTAGASWALPALLLAASHVPLLIVQRDAQFACAAVLCASAVVVLARRDRFEWGWMR